MVKYGKTFREKQIKEWEDKYVNYKKLKQKINKLIGDKKEKNLNDLSEMERNEIINNLIKEFTDELDKEIRMIYIFFSKKEKQLYKDINVYLHIKDDYTNYGLEDYLSQYQELQKVSITDLNLSNYVYYNLKACIKILKKFDKKVIGLKDKDNHIKINYIITKLEEQNSDILYLINFKMIDEVNVILDDLISCLKEQFKLRKSEFKTQVVEFEVGESENSSSEILLQSNNKLNLNQVNNIMEDIHKDIKKNIKQVDIVSSEITKLFLPWKKFLRISGDVSSRLIQLSRELNSFSDSGGESALMFRNNKSIADTISFSKQNTFNIFITLSHAFLYMFSYSVIIPTYQEFIGNQKYWKIDGKKEKLFCGLLMMMVPIGSIVSYIYESNLFMKTTKIPMVISLFGILLGNILFHLSIYIQPFYLLYIGRFLVGIFNLRTHNKMYIINFLLKKDVSFYLTMFHSFSLLGMAFGFLINLGIMKLPDEIKFLNKFTAGCLFSSFISFILFILSIIFFTEARSSTFNMTTMKSFIDNPGKSFISTNSNINNNTPDASMENPNISNLIYESEEISEDIRKKTVMVNDINAQLGDFNRKSNYNDTNMVSLSISELAFKEKEGLHSLFTSFIVYLTIIFTTKYINEVIFINSNLLIKDNYDGDWKIPTFFGSSCLIILLIEFCLRNKNKIISEKSLLMITFFLNLIIDFLLLFLRNSDNLIIYIIICLAIILINIIEKYATHFFYSIIPQDYSVCKIKGNILINIFSMFAKIVSSVFLIVLSDNENYNLIIYLTFIILSFICLILFLVFYSDIRIKSISRIMDKLGKNEVKIATEV